MLTAIYSVQRGGARTDSIRMPQGRLMSVGIGLRSGFGLRVLDTCRSEDIRQAVVPFSAGVLKERPLHPSHRYFPAPRSRPRAGIVDGEFVANRVGIDSGEPL